MSIERKLQMGVLPLAVVHYLCISASSYTQWIRQSKLIQVCTYILAFAYVSFSDICVMAWASVALHNTHIKCYFYKWLFPPSDMDVIGFHINKIKAWTIS